MSPLPWVVPAERIVARTFEAFPGRRRYAADAQLVTETDDRTRAHVFADAAAARAAIAAAFSDPYLTRRLVIVTPLEEDEAKPEANRIWEFSHAR